MSLLLLATVSACTSKPGNLAVVGNHADISILTGTVTCSVRTVLPYESFIQVELVDITLPGAPPRTIGFREISTVGRQFPIPFSIPYPVATIDPNRVYALRVRMHHEHRLLFANTVFNKVITNGVLGNVDVIVDPVPDPKNGPR